MTMKVKNAEKRIVYVGELMASKQERTNAINGLVKVLHSVSTKEISLPDEQVAGLRNLQQCLLDLRPVDDKKAAKH